jgi:ABC-type lipoprotein export system ATPase subunit
LRILVLLFVEIENKYLSTFTLSSEAGRLQERYIFREKNMKKIIKMHIKNSLFFDNNFEINFSEKMNCIMGGRGTGKSTLLYMIKSCIENDIESDSNIFGLLKNNLADGLIELEYEDLDGKKYKIRKIFEENPTISLLESEEQIEIKKMEEIFHCDIYEASAIEVIGRNSLDRLKLLDKMHLPEVKKIMSEIKNKQIELEENANNILTIDNKLEQINNQLAEFEDVDEQFEIHKKNPPIDVKEDEKTQYENADKNEKIRISEQRLINEIETYLKENTNEIIENIENINDFIKEELMLEKIINKEIIDNVIENVNNFFKKIMENRAAEKKIIIELDKKMVGYKKELLIKHKEQEKTFIELKQKYEKNRQYYTTYNKLSKKVDEKKQLLKIQKSNLKDKEKFEQKRDTLLKEFVQLKADIFNIRLANIEKLNAQFENAIKITLTFSGITDQYEELLKEAFKGSKMRYNILIPRIVKNFSPEKFVDIIFNKKADSLKEIAGIEEIRADEIFSALHDKNLLFNLEILYCPDLPEFFLKVDAKDDEKDKTKQHYRKTEELSTGQRCTTILPIIFAVSENPLIIDQPEDNLDNKYIVDTIHDIIRKEKDKRQLIFITHNPNIPVLSDSNYNVFLSYKDKKSLIETSGEIKDVKIEIIRLLEGGEEAFKKRKEIYGV